jgi:hypothetical protein
MAFTGVFDHVKEDAYKALGCIYLASNGSEYRTSL